MKTLYPFWRMAYVSAKNDGPKWDDPFAEIPKQADEKKFHLIFRGKTGYLVMNAFPYNAGHLLAIPYRAVGNLADLTAEERAELMDLIVLGQEILTKTLHPHGFNVGFNLGAAAGAGIPKHLHCHIVPRWDGDHNFMPVISDTHCLSSSMDFLWENLKKNTPPHKTQIFGGNAENLGKRKAEKGKSGQGVPAAGTGEKNGVPAGEKSVPAEVVPACPKCGKSMILRVAKRGRNAGKSFWSCPDFPKCNGSRNAN